MLKTLHINLGGMAFIIDETSFEVLRQYLDALKIKFRNETAGDEILADIESRLAEMFSQQLGGRKEVIGMEDVQRVIAVMGRPEDIAGDGAVEEPVNFAGEQKQSAASHSTRIPGAAVKRRLFRDADDKKVGGVISGICHYLNIEDPTWLRVALVFLVIAGFGIPILVYLVLWLVVPEAVTASDKLMMKGEAVTIDNIQREIKETAGRLNTEFSRMGRDNNLFERSAGALGELIRIILKVIAVLFVIGCTIALVAITATFLGIGSLIGGDTQELIQLVFDSSRDLAFLNAGVFLAAGVPLFAIIYACVVFITEAKSRPRFVGTALLLLWVIGLIMLSYSGVRQFKNFQSEASIREKIQLMQARDSVLVVDAIDTTGSEMNVQTTGSGTHIVINGRDIKDLAFIEIGKPHLELIPAATDSFYMEKLVSSQGRDREDARKNAAALGYKFTQTDTTIFLSANWELSKNAKWRAQSVKILFAIPEGRKVKFGPEIDRLEATVRGDDAYDDTYFANTSWTVKNGKVICLDCAVEEKANESKIKQAERKLREAEKKLEKAEKEYDELDTEDKDSKEKDI